METIDKKTGEESKKSSSLKEGTSENLAETFKSERVKLQKCLGEMFANECYRYVYRMDWGARSFKLSCFFDPKCAEYMDEDDLFVVDDWAPIFIEKFLKSYKNHNGKIYGLKLQLPKEDVEDIIKNFVDKLCKSRDQKLAEGTWYEYIKYKGALYGADKKGNNYAKQTLDKIEL